MGTRLDAGELPKGRDRFYCFHTNITDAPSREPEAQAHGSHGRLSDHGVVVVAGGVAGAAGVVPWSVVAGGVAGAGAGTAGCSVVVAGAVASIGALLPNQPAYHPMIASRMTAATMPMMVFLLSIVPSLALIAGLPLPYVVVSISDFKAIWPV
ncbi:MAG: hypothetical protein WCE69_13745 [Aestuariivirga sp.]